MSGEPTQSSATTPALLAGTLLILVAAGTDLVWRLVTWDLNGTRLIRSHALVAGADLYPAAGEGVAQISVYPPFGAVAYLPATLLGRPTPAIVTGQLLSIAWVLVPLVGLLCWWARRRGSSRLAGLGLLTFLAVAIDLRPLEYAMFTIHVDAPTLGCSLAAMWALLASEGGRRRRLVTLAAGLAVLACWSKQVALPVPLAMVLGLWWLAGRRPAFRLVGWLGLWSLLSTVVVVAVFGPFSDLWRHLVLIPGRHSPEVLGSASISAAVLAAKELSSVWALVALTLILRARRVLTPTHRLREGEGWTLFLLAGVACLPLALLGRVKAGGDANAFALCGALLLTGAVLGLARTAVDASETPRTRRLATVVLWGTVWLSLLAALLLDRPWETLRGRSLEPPDAVAYRFVRERPGQVYLPRSPLATWLAEHRFDHQSLAIGDLAAAGETVSEEHFRAHLPPDLRWVAAARSGFQEEVSAMPLRLERVADDPDLPGFDLYAVDP